MNGQWAILSSTHRPVQGNLQFSSKYTTDLELTTILGSYVKLRLPIFQEQGYLISSNSKYEYSKI